MTETILIPDAAQGVDQANKNNNIAQNIMNTAGMTGVKKKERKFNCPFGYDVSMIVAKVEVGERPIFYVGSRFFQSFNSENPLEARGNAFIYAAGLTSILRSEYSKTASVITSASLIPQAGDQNYYAYHLQIHFRNALEWIGNEDYLIYDSSDNQGFILENNEAEYNILQSMGHNPKDFSTVQVDG